MANKGGGGKGRRKDGKWWWAEGGGGRPRLTRQPQKWTRLRRDVLLFFRASPDIPERNVCTAVWNQ